MPRLSGMTEPVSVLVQRLPRHALHIVASDDRRTGGPPYAQADRPYFGDNISDTEKFIERVEHELLRQDMQDFAIFGQRDATRRFNRSTQLSELIRDRLQHRVIALC